MMFLSDGELCLEPHDVPSYGLHPKGTPVEHHTPSVISCGVPVFALSAPVRACVTFRQAVPFIMP
jgi:hypothetical protein